jgi:5'/3'-nucleotidase
LVAAVSIVVTANAADARRPLRILVTNDDGVGAAGIAAVVDALQGLRNVEVRVVAPATNQSGTGASFSTTPLHVTPATTASGDAATAVAGFPADTVLYDVLAAHDDPDVVVSGINAGQNLGNITEVSGTVGAARTANRLGIPAIAVSQGFASTFDYSTAARLTTLILEAFRHRYEKGTAPAQTINVNVPSCQVGSVRGVRLLPLGQTSRVGSYTVQSGSIDNGTFAPVVVNQNAISTSDCTSTLTRFTNDIEAFNNGFATATILNPDFTDPSVYKGRSENRWEGIDRRLVRH